MAQQAYGVHVHKMSQVMGQTWGFVWTPSLADTSSLLMSIQKKSTGLRTARKMLSKLKIFQDLFFIYLLFLSSEWKSIYFILLLSACFLLHNPISRVLLPNLLLPVLLAMNFMGAFATQNWTQAKLCKNLWLFSIQTNLAPGVSPGVTTQYLFLLLVWDRSDSRAEVIIE